MKTIFSLEYRFIAYGDSLPYYYKIMEVEYKNGVPFNLYNPCSGGYSKTECEININEQLDACKKDPIHISEFKFDCNSEL
jgi:hypothetical protein